VLDPVAATDTPLAATDVRFDQLFRLDGRSFVVIGAGAGIGEHVSRAICALGGQVLCVDADRQRAAAIGAALDAPHLAADATDAEAVGAVRDRAVSEFAGTLHGFVDVVGLMHRKPLPEFSLADWQEAFRINLQHAFLTGQALAPLVDANGGGSIVYVSSVMGRHAGRRAPGYGPGKAALEVWVKQLAAEYGPRGVRVNAVAPGLFLSPRFLARSGGGALARSLGERTMLRRLGQPYEIAGTVAFLLSAAAGYVTASVLPVEGGALSVDSTGLDELPD
jgi:NAD(P)-dependent dehydrogenase (short-subunit alcohol dehydrogenase family)